MEEGLAAILWLSVELILVYTGRGVIAAVSLGRWRGEQIQRKEGKIYSAAGSFWFVRDGQRVITANGLFIAGLIFYVALMFVLVYLAAH